MGLEIIDRFTKESGYDFLSNFYRSTVRYEGRLYPTVEHAYQAAKSLDDGVREMIRRQPDPMQAKKMGQGIQRRTDWDDVRVDIMRSLVHEKFENPFLRPRLKETGTAMLVMGNRWNDTFWGVCRGTGENWLGRILMEERSRIEQEETADGTNIETGGLDGHGRREASDSREEGPADAPERDGGERGDGVDEVSAG
jgi:ribA/ribD-fused uncharacterized protein